METEDYEPSLLESQLVDWLEGLGASEDAEDILAAFMSLGLSRPLSEAMLKKLAMVPVGWQQRWIDPVEGPSLWNYCDGQDVEIYRRSGHEVRPVFASNSPHQEEPRIPALAVKSVRDQTDAPLKACMTALRRSRGYVETAVALLRDPVQRRMIERGDTK